MSTTDTTPSTDSGLVPGPARAVDDRTGQESVWGAPPPGSAARPGGTGGLGGPAETVRGGGSGRTRWPQTVKTKVAALLAAAGLIVGGAAGAAVGHSTAGTSTPAGRTGQFGGPGGTQGGAGGPGSQQGTSQQGTGQSGTGQSGTGQSGTGQSGTGQSGAAQPGAST
jgi:hypothetical protein